VKKYSRGFDVELNEITKDRSEEIDTMIFEMLLE